VHQRPAGSVYGRGPHLTTDTGLVNPTYRHSDPSIKSIYFFFLLVTVVEAHCRRTFLASLHHRHQRTTFRICFVFVRFDNKLVKNIFSSVSWFFFFSSFFFLKKNTIHFTQLWPATSPRENLPPTWGRVNLEFKIIQKVLT
jgi:hypothetical protein